MYVPVGQTVPTLEWAPLLMSSSSVHIIATTRNGKTRDSIPSGDLGSHVCSGMYTRESGPKNASFYCELVCACAWGFIKRFIIMYTFQQNLMHFIGVMLWHQVIASFIGAFCVSFVVCWHGGASVFRYEGHPANFFIVYGLACYTTLMLIFIILAIFASMYLSMYPALDVLA